MLQIILFVCLSYLLIASDVVRGKPDYLYSDEAGGWLKLHLMPATWEEAFLRCHYEGAVLASPINKELAKALHSRLDQAEMINDRIFVGIHDLYSKGHFASVEGVPLSDTEIEWTLQTRANTGDCLTMSVNGDLVNVYTSSCTDPLPFICYKKFENQTINECGTFDNEYQFRRCSGSCYKVHQMKQTWTGAYGICSSEGAHLVILNDAEEARIIKDMFSVVGTGASSDYFHVGLRAWSTNRIWKTIHGESIEDVFNKWSDGQPNNIGGIQDRAVFVRQGTLEDMEPDFKAMFVCEKSPTSMQYEAVPLQVREKLFGNVPFSNNQE